MLDFPELEGPLSRITRPGLSMATGYRRFRSSTEPRAICGHILAKYPGATGVGRRALLAAEGDVPNGAGA